MFNHGLRHSTRQKFFDAEVKEVSKEEFNELKNYIIQSCDRKITYWNPNLRKIVEAIGNSLSLGELRRLTNELRNNGIDVW